MVRLSLLSAGVLFLAMAAKPAVANDSSANLAAGGLVLTKSAAIAMRSEDLFLSERLVRVRYRFENTSNKAVTVVVAFPMPDLTPDPDDIEGPPIPADSPANFLHFDTTVDGKPVAAQVELKAFANGVDQTALLHSLGVPVWPFRESTRTALAHLPKAQQDQLVTLGLIEDVTPDQTGDSSTPAAKSAVRTFRPLWTLKTTFFWKQTFPAGRVLSVEHTYLPVVGNWVGNNWAGAQPEDPDAAQQEKAENCVDDTFIAAVRARGTNGQTLFSFYLQYVLVTGANWMGPIGDFTMTIDKGSATNLVSFCGDGVRKTGPTTYQVHYTNFTPTKDVSVLFLEPPH